MNQLQIIDEHIIIRETVGYDVLKDVEVYDLPEILQFLKICYNYLKMQSIKEDV